MDANPHAIREAYVYLDAVQKSASQYGDINSIDWDNIPVHILPQKTVQSNPLKSKGPTHSPHRESFVHESKYSSKKKKIKYKPSSPSAERTYQEISHEPPKTVVGTCTTLEKQYFRSADDPDPSEVRPEHILKKAFDLMRRKAKQGEEWFYICSQMKSIRQDLVIQGIKNEFTVEVYETHARMCLENADIQEYHRCQGKLIELYNDGIKGNTSEFLAYRILYTLYTENTIDMNNILQGLKEEDYQKEEVKHALDVRRSISLGNWHQFFKLSKICPNSGIYVMKFKFRSLRLEAIKVIYQAYVLFTKILQFYNCIYPHLYDHIDL